MTSVKSPLPAFSEGTLAGRSSDQKVTGIGALPSDWEARTLGSIGTCLIGLTYKPANVKDHGRLVLRSSNIGEGILRFDDNVYVNSAVPDRILLQQDDLLICVRNGSRALIGKCALIDERAVGETFGAFMSVFRSTSNRFVFCCFQSHLIKRQIHEHLGATINQITNASLGSFRIPFPPPTERERIAATLSDVDGLIASLDRLIAKKRALKQAAMQQLLTGKSRLPGFSGKWDTKPLRALADITMGQSPASIFYNLRGNGLPLIQGNADIENRRTIARVWTIQASKRCIAGDILLTVRAPVGAVGIASESACLGRGVCGLRSLVDSSFLFHALVFAEPRWRVLEQGSTFTSANGAQVGQFEIRVPLDSAEQQSIGARLSDMDSELQALESRAAKARSIKQGMMQALLTGRVRLPMPVEAATLAADAEVTPASSRSHNWQINEAVVIGVLAKNFGSEAYPLGRKRYTKLSYLLHRHVEKQADGYLKKAAGPYNPSTKYGGPEKIALKNGYVKEHASGQYRGFVAGDGVAQADGYFEKWYGPEALTWLEQFRMRKNDALGVLATVDMAAQELRAAGREVTVPAIKAVLAADKEWKQKLSQPEFSDRNIAAAIEESARLFGASVTKARSS